MIMSIPNFAIEPVLSHQTIFDLVKAWFKVPPPFAVIFSEGQVCFYREHQSDSDFGKGLVPGFNGSRPYKPITLEMHSFHV